MIFDRDNSTLGIMDDLQVAVHTYDACSRGCPGCLVDTYFKNKSSLCIPFTKDKWVLMLWKKFYKYKL